MLGHVIGNPDRQITAPPEAFIVSGPVRDTVICFGYFVATGIIEFVRHLPLLAPEKTTEILRQVDPCNKPKDTYISINTGDGWETYDEENLYIVNGVMMHSDWGKNTTLGNIGFYTVDNEAVITPD